MSINKIYKFWAPWCVQCKTLAKELESWDSIPIIEINADEDEHLCEKYNIRGLPTLLFIDEQGKDVGRKVGMVTKQQVINFINELNNEIC